MDVIRHLYRSLLSCPNLNASHELLTQVCEGYVLTALSQRTGAEGFEGLRAKISPGAWREAVESI
jgi:hypothetical protein